MLTEKRHYVRSYAADQPSAPDDFFESEAFWQTTLMIEVELYRHAEDAYR